MFQAHSFLWHYLWVAPNLLFAVLAIVLWKRGLQKQLRGLFLYAWFQAAQCAVLFPLDHINAVSAWTYCFVDLISGVLEFAVVFLLVSDLFAGLFDEYAALAHVGRTILRWAGGALLIAAVVLGAFAPVESEHWLVGTMKILQQGMYVMVSGLLLLLFASAAYFNLAWERRIFGIALGLGISSCVHLATWGLEANEVLTNETTALSMANMATTHIVVLMWFYYLFVPSPSGAEARQAPPDNQLAAWNRELERLLKTK
jgi:hypothetical protein